MLHRLRHCLLDGVVVAHIQLDRQRPAAGGLDFFRGVVNGAGQARVRLVGFGGDHHIGAVAGSAQRDGFANST